MWQIARVHTAHQQNLCDNFFNNKKVHITYTVSTISGTKMWRIISFEGNSTDLRKILNKDMPIILTADTCCSFAGEGLLFSIICVSC